MLIKRKLQRDQKISISFVSEGYIIEYNVLYMYGIQLERKMKGNYNRYLYIK